MRHTEKRKKMEEAKKHNFVYIFNFLCILLSLVSVSCIYHFYISKRYLKTLYYCPLVI